MVLQVHEGARPLPAAPGKCPFRYPEAPSPLTESAQKACPSRSKDTPGKRIYTHNNVSIYEFDGADHKLYAQNLSLFAKLFLHVKSVFYDVSAFLYYLLVLENPDPAIPNTLLGVDAGPAGGQVVGFFSKEKLSWDNNNLACICVFPPWQKQGLAQVLIAASYELGRKDGRMGGPEKREFVQYCGSRESDN
jgi:GNAT superfamily N-acetyltransferase